MTIAFSVAIPAYNSAPFIGETLDAILNQTYPPAEVIVVDDGSTDETPSLLKKYARHVQAIHIENLGSGNARRLAIQSCSNNWVALCDSDDVWKLNHLQRKHDAIKIFPNSSILYANFSSFGPNSTPNYNALDQAPLNWFTEYGCEEKDDYVRLHCPYLSFLKFNFGYTSGMAFQRRIYNQVCNINPSLARQRAEDTDMTRRLLLHDESVAVVDKHITWQYRRHDNQRSKLSHPGIFGGVLFLEEHLREGIIPLKWQSAVKKQIVDQKKEAFFYAYWAGYYTDALKIFRSMALKDRSAELWLRAIVCQLRAR